MARRLRVPCTRWWGRMGWGRRVRTRGGARGAGCLRVASPRCARARPGSDRAHTSSMTRSSRGVEAMRRCVGGWGNRGGKKRREVRQNNILSDLSSSRPGCPFLVRDVHKIRCGLWRKWCMKSVRFMEKMRMQQKRMRCLPPHPLEFRAKSASLWRGALRGEFFHSSSTVLVSTVVVASTFLPLISMTLNSTRRLVSRHSLISRLRERLPSWSWGMSLHSGRSSP